MKRTLLSSIAILVPIAIFAQKEKLPAILVSFETDLRTEMLELTDWGKNQKITPLIDSESREPDVILNETRADFLEIPRVSESKTAVFNYRMYYKRIHLNDEKSVESFNKIYLAVRSEMDLVDLRAHTISPSGKVSKEFNENELKLVEEDGNRYLILAIDGAEKGGEVEYYYITRRELSEYGDIVMQGKHYVRNYNYTMRIPKHVEYMFKGYNGCPKVEQETKGDYNIYSLKAAKIPVLNSETFQSYDAEQMRLEYLLAYTENKGKVRFNTFADFSKNVVKNVHADKKESLSEIKKLGKKLKLAEMSSEEIRVRTIENWVKQNIVFDDNAVFKNIKELLKNKLANVSGLLRLYCFMFEENNICYQLWSTIDRDKKDFDETFESFNFLDGFYFYFPGSNNFLEMKNIAWRLGMAPSAILGQKAVQVKLIDLGDGVVSSTYSVGMAETPSCTKTNSVLDLEVKLNASHDKATVTYHATTGGYENFLKAAHTLVTDEVKRKELLEEQVKRASSDAVVSDLKMKYEDLNDITTYNNPVELDATFTTAKLLENANDKIIVRVGDLIGEQSELYSDKPRQTKLVNSYPHMYTRTIRIHIPEGYTAKGLDKLTLDKRYTNPNGEATDSIGFVSKAVIDGSDVVISCVEYYDCLTWPLARYEHYRAVINAAADFNKFTLVLDPKK